MWGIMDFNEIAIADTLRHPTAGVVSSQPDMKMHAGLPDGVLRVRGVKDCVLFVYAEDCTPATAEEGRDYWRSVKW